MTGSESVSCLVSLYSSEGIPAGENGENGMANPNTLYPWPSLEIDLSKHDPGWSKGVNSC